MLKFKKGARDVIIIDGNQIEANFSLDIDEKEDVCLVSFPAFRIHFYTKTRAEIDKSAHESLVSFFNYWMNEEKSDFINHMLELGFTVKSLEPTRGKSQLSPRNVGIERKFIKNDQFVIA